MTATFFFGGGGGVGGGGVCVCGWVGDRAGGFMDCSVVIHSST